MPYKKDLLLFSTCKNMWLLLFFTLFFYNSYAKNTDVYQNVFLLDEHYQANTVQEAISMYHKGYFNHPLPQTSFQKLKKEQYNWMLVKVPPSNKVQYLSVGNALFDVIELHKIQDSLSRLFEVNYMYRHPVWSLLPHRNQQIFLLKVQEKNAGFKVYLNLKLRDGVHFFKDIQIENLIFGCLIASLVLLGFFAFFIAFQKRNIAVAFFGVNIVFLIVRIFTATGLTSLVGIPKEFVLRYDIHAFAPMISVVSMLCFYYFFYDFPKKIYYQKKVIGFFVCMTLFCLVVNIYNLFFSSFFNTEFILQYIIIGGVLMCLLIHISLFYYRSIPLYLLFAFLLPFTAIFINTNTYRPLNVPSFYKYAMYNMVYFSKVIECVLVVIFIVKESFNRDFKLNKIENENLQLKLNLRDSITLTENKYRNKLLGDIHDTFGSYIETLSMSLNYKNTSLNTQEVIKAFRTEYRMLLNHLYNPNIDFNNLEKNIHKYCKNLNKINSNCTIHVHSALNAKLPIASVVCNEIYKVVTELVINSIKHAKCTIVEIELNSEENKVNLIVKDNGIGFVIKDLELTTFGLQSVKNRIELIKGTFSMDSKQNMGTVISITIPIEK